MERKLRIIINGIHASTINAGSRTAEEHQHSLMHPIEGERPRSVRVIEQRVKERKVRLKSFAD